MHDNAINLERNLIKFYKTTVKNVIDILFFVGIICIKSLLAKVYTFLIFHF